MWATVLMLFAGAAFAVPGLEYIFEGGIYIALLPLLLAVISLVVAFGIYNIKRWAWITAGIVGLIGSVIFIVDCFNMNIESYVGVIVSISLIVGLVVVRKYYV